MLSAKGRPTRDRRHEARSPLTARKLHRGRVSVPASASPWCQRGGAKRGRRVTVCERVLRLQAPRRDEILRARLQAALLLTVIACGACRSHAGSAFSRAAVLAPSSEAEAAHDELLHADIGRADSVARHGLPAGITSLFTDDILYLRGGLPIVRGRTAANAVASAESYAASTTVRWQPVRAEASRDRLSGFTYGYAIFSAPQPGAPAIRVDRYIAFWRREAAGWRIAGYAETYGTPAPLIALPPAAQESAVADVPMSRTKAPVDVIRSADEDFSRAAQALGTGEAFGRFAAEDAQIFSAPGELITGPEAITGSFGAPSPNSSLVWHPVDGELAKSGDLGFTVGNAVLTSKEIGPPQLRYSKYLTVWKRQRDGSWRYVVDGGSDRPKPP